MATEQVLEVSIRRHIIESERPFANVLDGIFGGISLPDTGALFSDLEASISYEQFSSLVQQAQGSAGLMRFWQLDLDVALTLDPQARDQAGCRLVRLIAGNPVTMGEMTRHVADAGSYAPVTILIQALAFSESSEAVAEVSLQLGEPPPNAEFPGERPPRHPVETGCLAGRRPPWTSAQTSIGTGATSPVNRDSERKTNDGSNYGTKE